MHATTVGKRGEEITLFKSGQIIELDIIKGVMTRYEIYLKLYVGRISVAIYDLLENDTPFKFNTRLMLSRYTA